MLVLTRKPDQQIQIGENIRITIVRVKGQSVRIGIEAPQEVRVMRTELTVGEESSPQPAKNKLEPAAAPSPATGPSDAKPSPAVVGAATELEPELRRHPFLPLCGRTPGASPSHQIRRERRLGPAVLRSMRGRI